MIFHIPRVTIFNRIPLGEGSYRGTTTTSPKLLYSYLYNVVGLVFCLHSFVKSRLLGRSAVINILLTSQQSLAFSKKYLLYHCSAFYFSHVHDSKSEETV
jgi:hypothetical protein